MDSATLNAISLFSGIGMLDVGVDEALRYLGIRSRVLAYCERDPYAATAILARMEIEALEPAPVWCGDIRKFPADRFHGVVDFITAGFPCQDLSVAGRRSGLDGARSGLFYEVLRVADDCGAPWLFLENVSGIASAGASVVDEAEGELTERAAARVMGELADRGWDAEWLHLRASDVGASHRRDRWFCLAWRMLVDAEGERRRQGRPEHVGQQGRHAATAHGGALGQSDGTDSEGGGKTGDEKERTEPDGHAGLASRELFAPGPADPRWGSIVADTPWLAPAIGKPARLNPNFAEFLMGWPIGWSNAYVDESSSAKESAARSAAHWRALLKMRIRGIVDAPSPRLQQTAGCGDSLSELSPETSSRELSKRNPKTSSVHYLQDDVQAAAGSECEIVREPGMFTPIRPEGGSEALERSHYAEELHTMRDGVHAEAGARDNMFPELRQQARMEQAMMCRADKLRCIGNGCVPLQVAAAFIELVRRTV